MPCDKGPEKSRRALTEGWLGLKMVDWVDFLFCGVAEGLRESLISAFTIRVVYSVAEKGTEKFKDCK